MPLESVEEFGNRWRDRAIEAESEIKRLRTMYDAVSAREHDLIEERDELREALTAIQHLHKAAPHAPESRQTGTA